MPTLPSATALFKACCGSFFAPGSVFSVGARFFVEINRQLVRLKIETRIFHNHVAAENADVICGIEERLVRHKSRS